MNEFSEMMNDRISIYNEMGELVTENQIALVDGGKSIITDGADFIVDVGYLVKRELPNGLVENYRVIEPNYYGGSTGMFKAHYQMKVVNVKTPLPTNNNVVNNITVSDNARFYKDSIDSSTNTYNSNQYQQALEHVYQQVSELDLHQSEKDLIKNSLNKIEKELKKDKPSKEILMTCFEFLPASVAALNSVIILGQMFGIY
ncbi:MAG: hypothetical protein RSD40_05115 [Bacilli bacterium]